MTVVANVQAMSDAVDKLTKKVKELDAAIKQTSGDSQTGFKGILSSIGSFGGQRNLGQGTTGNSIASSLAGFSSMSGMSGFNSMSALTSDTGMLGLARVGGIGAIAAGGAQLAATPFEMGYAGAMPTGDVLNRAQSYFQAARMYGLARTPVEQQTLGALSGGMTGVGSDAAVASMLSLSGFVPGTSNYLARVSEVRGAAMNYGISNEQATGAIASLSNLNIANPLLTAGIMTMNARGNQLSFGNISQQLFNRLYTQKVSAKDIANSVRFGDLQNQLAGFGITDPTQQQMFINAFTDIASGKNPDLTQVKNMSGNSNPASAIYQMNQSQTQVMQASEKNVLTGLQDAANIVTEFNKIMTPLIASMSKFKAILDGINSTNAGKSIKSGASGILGGLKKIAGAGLMLAGAATSEVGIGVPLAVAGAGLAFGGGNPGFGASNRPGPKGGGTPGSNLISAPFGATDSSGIWASTGNRHMGVDYNVPVGTDIHAVLDGIVSGQTLSSDYGQAVMIDHPNGYQSVYAHLSKKDVSPGNVVKRGQVIGQSGKSGNTTGPSLHYEVRYGMNNPVDPSTLPDASSPITNGMFSIMQNGSNISGGTLMTSGGSAQDKAFAKALLQKMGASTSSGNINALTTWMHWEGGTANNRYNPLNTTLNMPGSTNFNSEGVQSYTSQAQGVEAIYNTLSGQGSKERGYAQIISDLKGNAPESQTLSDISESAWASGRTGQNSYGGFKGGGTPGAKGITSQFGSNSSFNNVTINVNIAQASDQEAQLFAKKVKQYLERDNSISMIGSM